MDRFSGAFMTPDSSKDPRHRAAEWFVRLNDEAVTEQDRLRHREWRAESVENALAYESVSATFALASQAHLTLPAATHRVRKELQGDVRSLHWPRWAIAAGCVVALLIVGVEF